MTRPLPDGWAITLDPATRRIDGGRTLVGGNPLRILRLTPAGARWLDGDRIPRSAGEHALARRLVAGGAAHPVPTDAVPPLSCTVVVPVKDDPTGVEVVRASVGDGIEVVVVDDGSSPALPGATFRNPRPLGPGAARERGWRSVTADVVAFVDAGIALPPGWLAPLLAHFQDPGVGAVAPRTASRAEGAPAWLSAYEDVRSPLDMGPVRALVRPGSRVPYVPTTVVLLRRAALEAVDGFDPGLRYGEDVDLIWRLNQAGWDVRYEPSVVATHPCRPDLRAWLSQRVKYGRSAAPLAARHGTAGAPLTLSGWSALAWGPVLAGRPLVGVGVGAATTGALVPKLAGLDHPVQESLRLAGLGHLWAGRSVAEAVRRSWWPLAVLLAVGRRRARPALLAAAVLPPLLEWRERRPALGRARWTLLRLADDLAYGTGVWQGAIRARSLQALRPQLTGPLRRPTTD